MLTKGGNLVWSAVDVVVQDHVIRLGLWESIHGGHERRMKGCDMNMHSRSL
jgi:hypothetical protein